MNCELYAFLSRMFLEEPPKELATDILNQSFFSNLKPFCLNKKMEKGLEIIRKFSERFFSIDELSEALRQEYTELFLLPPAAPISLHEAHYSEEKTAETLLRLKDFYRKAGLQKAKGYREREDHLALELEFMHILCKNKNESKLQKDFLKHLNSWVPKVIDKIVNSPRAEFYKGIAYITKGLLKFEV